MKKRSILGTLIRRTCISFITFNFSDFLTGLLLIGFHICSTKEEIKENEENDFYSF